MYLVVNPDDGEAKNYRSLTDEEIGQFIAASYTVLHVTTPIASAALTAYSMNEDATQTLIPERT